MGMLDAILIWMRTHYELMSWLAVISASTFVVTLLAVPVLIIHIPEKYFLHEERTSRTPGADLLGLR